MRLIAYCSFKSITCVAVAVMFGIGISTFHAMYAAFGVPLHG